MGELWICMKVSNAMIKKEKCFKGNYIQERKEFQRKLYTRKKRFSKETMFKKEKSFEGN